MLSAIEPSVSGKFHSDALCVTVAVASAFVPLTIRDQWRVVGSQICSSKVWVKDNVLVFFSGF